MSSAGRPPWRLPSRVAPLSCSARWNEALPRIRLLDARSAPRAVESGAHAPKDRPESNGQEFKSSNARSQARPHCPNEVVGALLGEAPTSQIIVEKHEQRVARVVGVRTGRPVEVGDRRPEHGLVDARAG